MRSPIRRPGGPRRGVTLVEMLVVVALVLLMMTILVQIFQSATGAMTLSRTTQELDVVLRQVDSMIRSDLAGVTAKMTPPNDPSLKTGYFEYGENSFADAQGEDTDDWIAFTTKAPEGQFFSGRQFLGNSINNINQPITITSQVGEVIYFLRNGNLYRRVFLVAPERAKSIAAGMGAPANAYGYPTALFGSPIVASWAGLNDISCRPCGFTVTGLPTPLPNDLGDLTNRENRAFRPRFFNDFSGPNGTQDGIPDDNNNDGVNDYYPTLYFDGASGNNYSGIDGNPVWAPNGHTHDYIGYSGLQRIAQATPNSYDVYPFPFIYPGMYSVPEGWSVNNLQVSPPNGNLAKLGMRHGLFPGLDAQNNSVPNHAPLDLGDNLPAPSLTQSWFGFPTWRETMTRYRGTSGWGDPITSANTTNGGNVQGFQPLGLRPIGPTQSYSVDPKTSNGFPTPLTVLGTSNTPAFSDGAGSTNFIANPAAPNQVWEDDLILTNVRSFDIKAYDPNAPLYNNPVTGGPPFFSAGYQDLGYGSYLYLAGLTGNGATQVQNAVPFQTVNANNDPNRIGVSDEPVGFGHEGRIPPLFEDYRYHPRFYGFNQNAGQVFGNIGDSSPGVIRLSRVWDSWSTDYTKAPDSDKFLNGFLPGYGVNAPLYPSFPPPYPSPLRGIQIQIRLVDPRNERSKVLTIRHDFTDKL